MPKPQLEDGYTSIANELMEQFPRLWTILKSIYDMPVLLALIRKTYGYHKKSDKISLGQFAQITGINQRLVCRSLNNLFESNIITKDKQSYTTIYGLQEDYTKWKDYNPKIKQTPYPISNNKLWSLIKEQRISSLLAKYKYLPCEYCSEHISNSLIDAHHNDWNRNNNTMNNCRITHRHCHYKITTEHINNVTDYLSEDMICPTHN
jgi:phage replication O-like protein O